jgi:hypothetical protein
MSVLFALPAHPLLVHLTVVAIPLAALLAMVVAGFPRVTGLIKLTTLLLGALSVVLVPLMESSGKALEEKVPDSAAVERHAQLGETLLPWVIGLLIVIVAVLAADRWLRLARPGGSATSGAGRFRLAARVVTISVAVARRRPGPALAPRPLARLRWTAVSTASAEHDSRGACLVDSHPNPATSLRIRRTLKCVTQNR